MPFLLKVLLKLNKSEGKRSKFMDFARSFLLDEVELGFKKYPY